MAEQPTYDLRNVNIGRDFIGRDRIENVTHHHVPKRQQISQVAKDLEALLDYFEQHNPSKNEAKEKIEVAIQHNPDLIDAEIMKEAVTEVPTFKQRLRKACEAAYIETIKVLLPPIAPIIEGIKAFKSL
ncbi:MAG: hypothetical protein QNJ63_29885 [Calothrix sp. MO_192.B10]|nr:hypothetical protein [Calothrix sp. MO_192.B10]